MPQRFVYYRVPAGAVAAVQAALQPHVAAGRLQLLRRPEVHDGLVTLMEVQAPDLDAGAEATIAACVAPWLQGQRHVEVFEPL